MHNCHVCATSRQKPSGFESAQLHLEQIPFKRRRSTGVDASPHDVPLLLSGGHEIVCDNDIANGSRGDAVLHPHVRDQ